MIDLLVAFGEISTYCFYDEPERTKRGKMIRNRRLLHPEILLALKKLTGESIIWGKDCREWWAKNERGRQARRTATLSSKM
jgi:hypothetical protein